MFLKCLILAAVAFTAHFPAFGATAITWTESHLVTNISKESKKAINSQMDEEFRNEERSRPQWELAQDSSFLVAEGIENPFQTPKSDFPLERLQEAPMVVPKKPILPVEPPRPKPDVIHPEITLAQEEAIRRALEFEVSLSLSYAKLRNWNSRQKWNIDPVCGFTLGFKLPNESNTMAGFRLLSVTGAGTTQDSTGLFSYAYVGPYIANVEISEKSQTSLSAGFSLAKISGKTQVGPGEEEFERPPGLRTDPPGLWAEVKYGRMTGGAWSNGIITGIQWGRKRVFYWLGLFTSAWH